MEPTNQTCPVCKNNTLTYVIIFIAAFLIGIFGGLQISKMKKVDETNTYQAGWQAAKARLAASPQFGPMFNAKEVYSVSGTVESISGNNISIKINPLNPLDDDNPELDHRTAMVTASTTIIRMVQRDQKEFQKEMEAFMKNRQTVSKSGVLPNVNAPSPYLRQEIKVSDLKVGENINVGTNINIKELKEFNVLNINVQ